jgi:phosphoribosyl 1,2-cyclic phosphodiesterase
MSRQPTMTLKFWGVRGSIPSPGTSTMRYGGNTSCVSLHLRGGRTLVLDAGTGIRALGKELAGDTTELFVLLSHAHWDHIQGFPFFQPLYQSGRTISIVPSPHARGFWCSALEQMDGVHFPVMADDLPSNTQCITEGSMDFLQQHEFGISQIATNHPGGGSGYRIEQDGRSVVYLTDNELEPPYDKATDVDTFIHFCQQADVLIHDAQYLESDMPHKHGWGHSQVSQVCALAAAAEAKHLILFHHDPERTDDALDTIQETARDWLHARHQRMQCTAAFEGLIVDL